MNVDVITGAGKHETVELKDAVYGREYNEALTHHVVTSYLTNARSGTHAQKTRAAVSGGGIKPWRQKGTGRARAGSIRSPLWRGGGKVFAKEPRDYQLKINKKMYRGAMRCILSEIKRDERMIVVDSLLCETHKTRDFKTLLSRFNVANESVMIITDMIDRNLYLAAKNLPNVYVCDVQASDPASMIQHDKIIITLAAARQFEELLA